MINNVLLINDNLIKSNPILDGLCFLSGSENETT